MVRLSITFHILVLPPFFVQWTYCIEIGIAGKLRLLCISADSLFIHVMSRFRNTLGRSSVEADWLATVNRRTSWRISARASQLPQPSIDVA